jgi:NAD(P)H dehydrogenase (quinone)
MQVLVMYHSKTGHTKKLAEEIAKGVGEVKGVECIVKSAADVTKDDFIAADGIIAGSPVYFGTMAAELKAVFDQFVGVRRKMEGKIGAAFATSGDLSGGRETTIISIIQALLIYGMIIVGDPLDATGHYGVSCVGSPDKSASLNAALLGKRVATLVKKLKSSL